MTGKMNASNERYEYLRNNHANLQKQRRSLEEDQYNAETLIEKLNEDLDKMHEKKMELKRKREEDGEKMKELKQYQVFQEKSHKQLEDKFRQVKRDLEDKLGKNIEQKTLEKHQRMKWI